MSLTTISQVRNHLNRFNPGEGDLRHQPIRLTSGDYAGLPHAHIVSGSETVKALENDRPNSETVMLAAEAKTLNQTTVVPDTVVCAADSSLSIIYQENIDFAVDYIAGAIRRIDSGSILSGSTVTVWYLHYRLYQRGIDYMIDYERGRLMRLVSGAIEEGQELLVDYRLGSTEFSDSEIDQCMAEADSEITQIIDPAFRESTDPALQTAATCLTLAYLCRNTAGMTAAGPADSDRYVSVWMDLAQSYRETALRLLAWFGRETPGFHSLQLT